MSTVIGFVLLKCKSTSVKLLHCIRNFLINIQIVFFQSLHGQEVFTSLQITDYIIMDSGLLMHNCSASDNALLMLIMILFSGDKMAAPHLPNK